MTRAWRYENHACATQNDEFLERQYVKALFRDLVLRAVFIISGPAKLGEDSPSCLWPLNKNRMEYPTKFGGDLGITKSAGSDIEILYWLYSLRSHLAGQGFTAQRASLLLGARQALGALMPHSSWQGSVPRQQFPFHADSLSSSINHHFIYHCDCFHFLGSFILSLSFCADLASTHSPRGICKSYTSTARTVATYFTAPVAQLMPDICLTNVTFSTRSDVYSTISIVALHPTLSC